ncbi:MAG TPA: DUF2147 domain-containing protein [Cyclobacteriaceae bacterium]
MKYLSLLISSVLLTLSANAQEGIMGKWKTIDEENEPKSVVEIFERDSLVYGKIIKLYRKPGEDIDPSCVECASDDPRYKKKVIGMEVLKDMKKTGKDEYSEGTVLDPSNGRVYSCKIWLEEGKLMIRGYWGPFFRTQTWHRLQ